MNPLAQGLLIGAIAGTIPDLDVLLASFFNDFDANGLRTFWR